MKRYYNPHTNESTHQTDAAMRFKCPYDNLLYAVLIRAARDGDTEYLRNGDGREIWEYLKTRELKSK